MPRSKTLMVNLRKSAKSAKICKIRKNLQILQIPQMDFKASYLPCEWSDLKKMRTAQSREEALKKKKRLSPLYTLVAALLHRVWKMHAFSRLGGSPDVCWVLQILRICKICKTHDWPNSYFYPDTKNNSQKILRKLTKISCTKKSAKTLKNRFFHFENRLPGT